MNTRSNMAPTDPTTAPPPAAANVRLGDFDQQNPKEWFYTAECILDLHDITDEVKKMRLLSLALQPPDMKLVMNQIGYDNMKKATSYAEAKKILVKAYSKDTVTSASDMQRNSTPFTGLPSLLLSELRNTQSCTGVCSHIIACWMRRLPPHITTNLCESQDSYTYEKLAEQADQRYHRPPVEAGLIAAATGPDAQQKPPAPRNNRLKKDPHGKICPYHYTYKDKAQRCRPMENGPCQYNNQQQQSGNC